jgi:hypothetical protein
MTRIYTTMTDEDGMPKDYDPELDDLDEYDEDELKTIIQEQTAEIGRLQKELAKFDHKAVFDLPPRLAQFAWVHDAIQEYISQLNQGLK